MTDHSNEPTEEKPPILKLAEAIIGQSLVEKASSVTIIPTDGDVQISYVSEGKPREAMTVPKNLQLKLIKRFKIMANMDVESVEPQLGKIIGFSSPDKKSNFDVATELTEFGEKVSITLVSQPA